MQWFSLFLLSVTSEEKNKQRNNSLHPNLTTGHEDCLDISRNLTFCWLKVLPTSISKETIILAKSQQLRSSNLHQNSATQEENNQNFKLPEQIQKSFPLNIYYHVYRITSILKLPLEVYKSGAQITNSYTLQIFKAYRALDLYKIL